MMHLSTERPTPTETAPKKVHIIWLGGAMPIEYLVHLNQLAIAAKNSGFELNLWTDNVMNYHHAVHKLPHSPTTFCPGLQLRDINTLYDDEHPVARSAESKAKIISLIDRERVGFRNLAAASDILRLAILEKEGGTYLDADNQLEFEQIAFRTDSKHHQSLGNTKLNIKVWGSDTPLPYKLQAEKLKYGIKIKSKDAINPGTAQARFGATGNDVITSVANAPLITQLLNRALSRLNLLDNTKLNTPLFTFFSGSNDKNNALNIENYAISHLESMADESSISTLETINHYEPTLTDLKRVPYIHYRDPRRGSFFFDTFCTIGDGIDRLGLTMLTTGPGIFTDMLRQQLQDKDPQAIARWQPDSTYYSYDVVLGNLVSASYDGLWYKGPTEEMDRSSAFDDASISLGTTAPFKRSAANPLRHFFIEATQGSNPSTAAEEPSTEASLEAQEQSARLS
jgi:hypothetical protein